MIDTDKYEGHTPAPWRFEYHPIGLNSVRIYALPKILEGITPTHRDWTVMEITAVNLGGRHNREEHNMNAKLIADAPLLLEEVKDLQKKLDNLREYCHAEGYDIFNWEVKNIEVIE